jgi:hypothetical protein
VTVSFYDWLSSVPYRFSETFAQHIRYDIFHLQHCEMFLDASSGKLIQATGTNRMEFLYSRVVYKATLGANESFAEVINASVERLLAVGQLHRNWNRERYVHDLCMLILRRNQGSLVKLVTNGPAREREYLDRPAEQLVHDIAAAAAFNERGLFRRLLDQLPANMPPAYVSSSFYGNPVRLAAAIYGHHDILVEVNRYIATHNLPNQPWVFFSGSNDLIQGAIVGNRLRVLEQLLKLYGRKLLNCYYEDWLHRAALLQNTAALHIILDAEMRRRVERRQVIDKLIGLKDISIISKLMQRIPELTKTTWVVRKHEEFKHYWRGENETYNFCILHSAMAHGNDEILRLVLDAGIDANGPPGPCYPPLHYAIRSRYSSSVKILFEYGAEINYHPTYYHDTLQLAANIDDESLYELVRQEKLKTAAWVPELAEIKRGVPLSMLPKYRGMFKSSDLRPNGTSKVFEMTVHPLLLLKLLQVEKEWRLHSEVPYTRYPYFGFSSNEYDEDDEY